MRSVPNWPLVFSFPIHFYPFGFFYMCATDVLCALRVVFFPIIDCCTVHQSGKTTCQALQRIDQIIDEVK